MPRVIHFELHADDPDRAVEIDARTGACRAGAPLAALPQLSATIVLVRLTIRYQPPPRSTNCHCRLVLPSQVHCCPASQRSAWPPSLARRTWIGWSAPSMRQSIARVSVKMLPDCGHALMQEQPAAVLDALVAFF